MLLLGNVEQESLIAVNFPVGIAGGETILQRGQQRAVFAAQVHLKIANKVVGFNLTPEDSALFCRGVEVRIHVSADQLFPAGIAHHADKSIVTIEQLALGGGYENTFLNLFE